MTLNKRKSATNRNYNRDYEFASYPLVSNKKFSTDDDRVRMLHLPNKEALEPVPNTSGDRSANWTTLSCIWTYTTYASPIPLMQFGVLDQPNQLYRSN